MKKISVRIKPKMVDLRVSSMPTVMNHKQKIIFVFSQLIKYTENQIESSLGDEKKKNQFRLAQFKKATKTIQDSPLEINSGLQARELPGIGKGIADRIDEIIQTGTLKELSLQHQIDAKTELINQLTTVTGIGESNANKFIEQGIRSVDDLIERHQKGQIKLTHHMEMGVKYYHDLQQKIPFSEITEINQIIRENVGKIFPNVMIEICGSHRRKKSFSGDIDVLMTSPSVRTEDEMIVSETRYLKTVVKQLKECGLIIDDLTSQGDTKYMGICCHPKPCYQVSRHIDIRFVPYESFYPAVLYFTGSMVLNVKMRQIAIEKGYLLNEYGLYSGANAEHKIPVSSEKEIFDLLGIVYLLPEERDLQ